MSKVLGDHLPKDLVEMLNQAKTTAVLSSVTGDGSPHAMPVHAMVAPDDKSIRVALLKNHQTTENLTSNDRAFLTVMEGGDMAYGIRCRANLVKDPMEKNKAMCMFLLEVQEVKSDTTPTVIVLEGVKIKHRSPKTEEFIKGMFEELRTG